MEKGELLGSLGLRALWDHGGLKASKEIRDRPELQETPANPSILLSQWADGSPFTALTTTRPWSSTTIFVNSPEHFDMFAGKYRCHIPGIYFFNVNIHTWNFKETYLHIMQNNSEKAIVYAQAQRPHPSCRARASCCLYRRATRSGSVSTNVSVRTPSIVTMWTSTSPLTDTSSNQKLSERDIHGHEV